MNKLLLVVVLVLGCAGLSAAQSRTVAAPNLPVDSLPHRIKFANTIPVAGVSAAELQARAREWVALTFQDAHQTTQLDDAARGVLILRGFTNAWLNTRRDGTGGEARVLSFTLRLDFRDGRYHYEVYDLGWANVLAFTFSAPATGAASDYSAHAIANWQSGAMATVAASPRQGLLQPDYAPNRRDYDVAKSYGSSWPEVSNAIYKAIKTILVPLREREMASPIKF